MVTVTSEDGRVWNRVGVASDGPWFAVPWGESLVGPDDMSVPELLISDAGETWEKAGLAPQFPVAINWSSYPMGAGPAGVALAVSGSSAGPQIGIDRNRSVMPRFRQVFVTAGASHASNVIRELSYDESSPQQAISEAVEWAEAKLQELQVKFDGTYPWRKGG